MRLFLNISTWTYVTLAGAILCSGCQMGTDSVSSILGWYPSTVQGYAPYRISVGGPNFPVPLKAGQTKFTKDEVVRYTEKFIDERRKLIGVDSNSLRLIEAVDRSSISSSGLQLWNLTYEQATPYMIYRFKIAKVMGR